MNRALSNSITFFLRHIFVFTTMLLMLLTSCSVKAGIKNIAGTPVQTEHNTAKSNQKFLLNASERCAGFKSTDTLIVQKVSFTANDLLPVALFTAALFFLFCFRSVSKEQKHPLYSGSAKISNTIPLFLQYRKLIVHFSH